MNVSTPSIVPAAQTQTSRRASQVSTILDDYTAAFEHCYPGVPIQIRGSAGKYRVFIRGEWTKDDAVLDLEGIVDATKALLQ